MLICGTPKMGTINQPQSRLNVHTPRNPDANTSTHSAMTVPLVFVSFSVMVILTSLIILLSPHPSGRSCRITLVDARMRRGGAAGGGGGRGGGGAGAQLCSHAWAAHLERYALLVKQHFWTKCEHMSTKADIYISINEGRVKWVQRRPENLTNSQRTIHIEQENIWRPALTYAEELCGISGRNIFGSVCIVRWAEIDNYSRLSHPI